MINLAMIALALRRKSTALDEVEIGRRQRILLHAKQS